MHSDIKSGDQNVPIHTTVSAAIFGFNDKRFQYGRELSWILAYMA